MQEAKTKKNRKQKVVARMTITFTGSTKRTIVEVHEGASFTHFYKWFSQVGRKRKSLMRTCNRNEGINPQHSAVYMKPGLDVVCESLTRFMKNIENVQIKIFKKGVYKKMLTCAPEALGSLPTNTMKIEHWSERVNRRGARGYRVQLPTGRLTLQQRMDILTGVK